MIDEMIDYDDSGKEPVALFYSPSYHQLLIDAGDKKAEIVLPHGSDKLHFITEKKANQLIHSDVFSRNTEIPIEDVRSVWLDSITIFTGARNKVTTLVDGQGKLTKDGKEYCKKFKQGARPDYITSKAYLMNQETSRKAVFKHSEPEETPLENINKINIIASTLRAAFERLMPTTADEKQLQKLQKYNDFLENSYQNFADLLIKQGNKKQANILSKVLYSRDMPPRDEHHNSEITSEFQAINALQIGIEMGLSADENHVRSLHPIHKICMTENLETVNKLQKLADANGLKIYPVCLAKGYGDDEKLFFGLRITQKNSGNEHPQSLKNIGKALKKAASKPPRPS